MIIGIFFILCFVLGVILLIYSYFVKGKNTYNPEVVKHQKNIDIKRSQAWLDARKIWRL